MIYSIYISAVSRTALEILSDLTALVTLNRGCEVLQQAVDDHYRQVSIPHVIVTVILRVTVTVTVTLTVPVILTLTVILTVVVIVIVIVY